MTKVRAGWLVAGIVLALAMLDTWLILEGKRENRRRVGETRALAVETHALAVANCRDIAGLARVQRAFINRQEGQTQGLLKAGITFGIPRKDLPALIHASRSSQALFLHELDMLTNVSCASGGPLVLPSVRLGKAKRKTSGKAPKVRAAPRAPSPTSISAPPTLRSPRATIGPHPRARRLAISPQHVLSPAEVAAPAEAPPATLPASPPATAPLPPVLPVPGLPPPCERVPPLKVLPKVCAALEGR